MKQDESAVTFNTTWIREFPPDLVVTVLLALLTGITILVPGTAMTRLRLVLGIPFLLFFPGYVLISALFPRTKDVETESSSEVNLITRGGEGIDGFERVSLSIGTSVAVNSMIGFLLNFTPWGIRLVPTLVSIILFTVVTAIVAGIRRHRTPPTERFSVPFWDWAGWVRRELFEPDTPIDTVLNAVMVVSLILAIGSVAYAIGLPYQQDSFTQFYILANDGSGNPTAEGYPQNFTVGENELVYVGIENHEHRRVTYTVVILLQKFEDNSTQVRRAEQLDRVRVSVPPNQTALLNRSVAPTMRGNRLRLAYLLYKGTPPKDPAVSTAYRTAYLWINVSKPEENQQLDRRELPSHPYRSTTLPGEWEPSVPPLNATLDRKFVSDRRSVVGGTRSGTVALRWSRPSSRRV